jgi:hypothetical protein
MDVFMPDGGVVRPEQEEGVRAGDIERLQPVGRAEAKG